MSDPIPSRLSYAHGRADLRVDNPLYERAGSLRAPFDAARQGSDAEREARRESFMVKRDQPKPVLRPSRALALGPDGAAFDSQWQQERAQARPAQRGRQS